MIPQFWRRITRTWSSVRARQGAAVEHASRMIASEHVMQLCNKFRNDGIVRSNDIETYRQVNSICNAIQFLELATRDLEVLAYQHSKQRPPELHNLHIRFQALIIYEVLRKRGAILGADVHAALNAHNLVEARSELRSHNKALNRIEQQYHVRLKRIRNTVIAHRDASDPSFSMALAGPDLIIVDLITRQVQGCFQDLTATLLNACLEIVEALPTRKSTTTP